MSLPSTQQGRLPEPKFNQLLLAVVVGQALRRCWRVLGSAAMPTAHNRDRFSQLEGTHFGCRKALDSVYPCLNATMTGYSLAAGPPTLFVSSFPEGSSSTSLPAVSDPGPCYSCRPQDWGRQGQGPPTVSPPVFLWKPLSWPGYLLELVNLFLQMSVRPTLFPTSFLQGSR